MCVHFIICQEIWVRSGPDGVGQGCVGILKDPKAAPSGPNLNLWMNALILINLPDSWVNPHDLLGTQRILGIQFQVSATQGSEFQDLVVKESKGPWFEGISLLLA